MRITVTVKGEIEKYIENQIEVTGLSAGMVAHSLIMSGMEYRSQINAMNNFASALNNPLLFNAKLK